MSLPVLIYGVADPRTGELRYIGKTISALSSRLRYHLNCRKGERTPRGCWFRKMKREGLTPDIFVLEETTEAAWEDVERFWIASMRLVGAKLLNMTAGGEGTSAPKSAAHKAAIGAANKGRVSPAKGKTFSPEVRANMSAAQKGRLKGPLGEEVRAKISEALRGKNRYPKTEAHRQKLREAQLALRA